MGKNDKRTRRGKIKSASYGKSRRQGSLTVAEQVIKGKARKAAAPKIKKVAAEVTA